ncbi:DNA methyltransferase [Dyella amyloliquefaciens]|uniref:DNA methyltransferase n=1 Tax=Dyella amyloliquefaciens TaxID=1770545 RepID=UPI00102E9B39|nr:DNA methyltransferase [Dyella amyloliquefaciens]
MGLSSLHQISPYIGKLKPRIARDLVESFSKPGDLVADPFCGSGTIPLEAALLGRRVFASDDNIYAQILTSGKLYPPASLEIAEVELARLLKSSRARARVDLESVPDWVRVFFHPETLQEALAFADECLEQQQHFFLSCFLGILHHQRPGFLSYPSSHLVPYLRSNKFPRNAFPSMYEKRDLEPRIQAKIKRALKQVGGRSVQGSSMVYGAPVATVELPTRVDAVITSPPYMNALDYRRDNRLRMWFIDRGTTNYAPEPTDKRMGLTDMVTRFMQKSSKSLKRGGKLVLVVGETVTRKRIQSHPSSAFLEEAMNHGLKLIDAIRDDIPDIRRSRRDCRGTKVEHILVFRKA